MPIVFVKKNNIFLKQFFIEVNCLPLLTVQACDLELEKCQRHEPPRPRQWWLFKGVGAGWSFEVAGFARAGPRSGSGSGFRINIHQSRASAI